MLIPVQLVWMVLILIKVHVFLHVLLPTKSQIWSINNAFQVVQVIYFHRLLPASFARMGLTTSEDHAHLIALQVVQILITLMKLIMLACNVVQHVWLVMVLILKIVHPAKVPLVVLTCCSKCAGQFVLRDSTPILLQASARFVLFSWVVKHVNIALLLPQPTAHPAFMVLFSLVLIQPASPIAIPTNTKIPGIIVAVLVMLHVQLVMAHQAIPASHVQVLIISWPTAQVGIVWWVVLQLDMFRLVLHASFVIVHV